MQLPRELSRAIYLLLLLFLVSSCASVKLNPPGPEAQSILILPYSKLNTTGRSVGYIYHYHIVNLGDDSIIYEAKFNQPGKEVYLVVDSLPPGNYRVDKVTVNPVGSGIRDFDRSEYRQNEKFKLVPGKITIFQKSIYISHTKDPTDPGRSFSGFRIGPVFPDRRSNILEKLGKQENFDKWEVLGPQQSVVESSAEVLVGKTDKSICRLALTPTGDWEIGSPFGSYSAEARRRGYTPEQCAVLLEKPLKPEPITVDKQKYSLDTEAEGISTFIRNNAKRSYNDEYTKMKYHKAFAQSRSGAWGWNSDRTSAEYAMQDALDKCREFNKGDEALEPCMIINVDGYWGAELGLSAIGVNKKFTPSNELLPGKIYIRIESKEKIFEGGQLKFTANPGDILEVIRVKICLSGNGVCWQVLNIKTGETGFTRADWLQQRHTVFEANEESISNSNLDELPVVGTESLQKSFTGAYSSEITGRVTKYIKNKNTEVKLVQSGNTITGIYGDSEGKIWGEAVGNTIKFEWSSSINPGYGTGKWTFKPGSGKVHGTWFNTALGNGKWNLTKIENGLNNNQAIPGVQPVLNVQPDSGSDITGMYVLNITSSDALYIRNRDNKLILTLEQRGNIITGTDESGKADVQGTRNGNTINFAFFHPGVSSNYILYGEWKISAENTGSEGSLKLYSGGSVGKWNLTKIK